MDLNIDPEVRWPLPSFFLSPVCIILLTYQPEKFLSLLLLVLENKEASKAQE